MERVKKLINMAVALILFSFSTVAHNLRGTISDEQGTPIAYATVYIKNLALGTTTNEEGKFELELNPGNYEVNFRCLGFKPKNETIKVTKEVEYISVILEVQILEMEEVIITGRGEDPAYAVMRKVIGLSYVHLNQITSYTADVYIRGTVKFQKVPAIIRNQLRRKNIDVKTGDVLVNETENEISFIAPSKYTQKVKSVNSTFPDVVDFSVTDFLGASLYQDNIEILITPLHRNAFSYYNFTYEGYSKEKQYIIDKIKVTPKIKSKQLFEGYIYIIEDLWCLHRADLKFNTPFGEVNLKLIYDEVHPGVWLPVGHNYIFNGGLLGVKADARFAASVKYNKIKVNEQVLAMAKLPIKTNASGIPERKVVLPQKKSEKRRALKIEELLEKSQLKDREVNKLSRLMAKEDKPNIPDSVKSLEIKDDVKVITEKGADKKDTAYWAAIRPIPLSTEELQSFMERDSLRSIINNQLDNNTVNGIHKRNYGSFNPLFFGTRFYMRDSTWQGRYSGLFTIKNINFNAVDGWNISQSFSFTRSYKPGKSIELIPLLKYSINKNVLLGTGTIRVNYMPVRRGAFQTSFGRNTLDFNGEKDGINPFINTVASIFFKENYARYYESRFLDFNNGIDLANGLRVSGNFRWEKVFRLENSTNFSFVKKNEEYSQNIPLNEEINETSLADQINSIAGLKIEYTPKYYYRIRDGVKRMSHSNYPTFYVQYEKGFKDIFSSTSDYDFVGAGILYGKELSSTSSIAYEVHSGWFTKSNQIHFSNFAHAPTQRSPVLLKEYRHAFFLPAYYELSTKDKFLRAHLSYKAPYIALKYLPVLSNTLWREMIWSSYFTTPTNRNYVEVGYTLLEVLLSANVGVFAGFSDGNFQTWGFNIAFRWTE